MREKMSFKFFAHFPRRRIFMRFTKKVKPAALFAAVLVLFAVLISCGQAVTSPAPEAEAEASGWVGHFPAERLSLIGKVPEGALSSLSMITGSPELSTVFPAFLTGIWEQQYGDSFHLTNVNDIGYSIFDWPPFYGWEGVFEAVYYFDDQHRDERGLVFADFVEAPNWYLTPPDGGSISAFYYQKIDANTYYLLNLAKEATGDEDFPGYAYGQPMYDTVEDALDDLIDNDALDGMLIVWVDYERQP
jgi:hypothetical protein